MPPPERRVLIVSPHFPPINAPDMQRVRMSLPYYRESGWSPVVLSVRAEAQTAAREPRLLVTLPPDLRLEETSAIPLWLSRRLGVGNLGLRAWFHLWLRGSRILRREKFDLVFFSNTQFITFVLGRLWKRRFGVPYVLDMQDPWRTDYYERPGSRRPPGGWKYQFARLTAYLFEGWSFRRASGLISVSPAYIEDLHRRHPGIPRMPGAVLGFGASRADLEHARRLPDLGGQLLASEPGTINLVYTGASGPVMPHALTVLFDALRTYRTIHPDGARRLRLHFIGTSYVAPGQGRPSVLPVAERCGTADQVREIPHRVGFLEAAQAQLAANGLLLLGSSDLAYSPSKVYLYHLTGRPILGLVFQDSVMERLLDELGCAWMARFSEDGPKQEAMAAVHRFFDRALQGFPREEDPKRNQALFQRRYLAEELTRQQCRLFDAARQFP